MSWRLAAVLVLCSASFCFALDPNRAITQYVHDVWQVDNGLPQNSIAAVIQTSDGYLWIGTQGGLVRFDGVQFTVFDRGNTPGLALDDISTLCEDHSGTLWIGTYGSGVSLYRNGHFTTLSSKDGLIDDNIYAMHVDHEGAMWFGGQDNGLSRYANGKFQNFTKRDGLSDNQIRALYEDQKGNLWIGTKQGGINVFANHHFKAITIQQGLSTNHIRAFAEDRNGGIWIGTGGEGLDFYHDDAIQHFSVEKGGDGDYVRSLWEDRAGNLWVGSSGGLYRLSKGSIASYKIANGLSDNDVRCFFEDREGNLWIGTFAGGLNRFKNGKVIPFGLPEGLPDEQVRTILGDHEGNIWIGTSAGCVRLSKDGTLKTFTKKDGLAHDHIDSLFEDRDGTIWIGTDEGISHLVNGKFSNFTTNQNTINCITQDHDGGMWFGTDGGISRLEGDHFKLYTTSDGLVSNHIKFLHEDTHHNMWIGTFSAGLQMWKDGKFTSFSTAQGTSLKTILTYYEDGQGRLWFGTDGLGLLFFDQEKLFLINRQSGLPENVIEEILEDDKGSFWISSNKGIFTVKKQDLIDLVNNKISRIQALVFGTSDGMRSRECNGGTQPAGWKQQDGKMWFATIRGAVMIDPDRITKNPIPPSIVLEDVLLNDKPVSNLATLKPGAEKLEIHYTALSLSDPTKVRFKYKLEGYDQDWQDAGTRRIAFYTHIPPGQYKFQVIACNEDGLWNDAGASLNIGIQPYFYQSPWFIAACALCGIVLSVGLHQLRTRQLIRKERELSELVQKRTQDLNRAKQELETANDNLEKRVQDGIDRLRESERLAAYGQMVAGVAHEVRHPIFAIQASTYMLGNKLKEQKDLQADLNVIQRETTRMNTLMSDLLEFARPDSLSKTSTDIGSIFEEAKSTFLSQPAAKVAPAVSCSIENGVPAVMLDRLRILQVLLNLMENARKHAEGVTVITLSAAASNSTKLLLRVSNDGKGIPAELIPKIFEPFFTSGKGGTGLGLAIARRIISAHEGTITVESTDSSGTVFLIELPSNI
ncbi:MAG: hypothetical protein C5B54_07150 [Acidobacteria bacterium]|nr:MAG: hypothetical protein C5B54_07150 [Acidobacteriota bacterium]